MSTQRRRQKEKKTKQKNRKELAVVYYITGYWVLLLRMAANFDFGMDEVLQSSQSSIVDEEEMAKMESEAVPDG